MELEGNQEDDHIYCNTLFPLQGTINTLKQQKRTFDLDHPILDVIRSSVPLLPPLENDIQEKRLDRSFTQIADDLLNSDRAQRYRCFSQRSVHKDESGSMPFTSQLSTFRPYSSDLLSSENIESSILT
jgi:hypothetical protein